MLCVEVTWPRCWLLAAAVVARHLVKWPRPALMITWVSALQGQPGSIFRARQVASLTIQCPFAKQLKFRCFDRRFQTRGSCCLDGRFGSYLEGFRGCCSDQVVAMIASGARPQHASPRFSAESPPQEGGPASCNFAAVQHHKRMA